MSESAKGAQRVLVIGPSWVGDMVMAQSLFKLLAEGVDAGHPPHIDLVAPPWSSPVARRMPEVSTIHDLPVPHGVLGLGVRRQLAVSLRDQHYDRAIVIPGTFKSALVPFWARIPVRTGYKGEHRYGLINDMRTLDTSLLKSTGERYTALGGAAGEESPPTVRLPVLSIDVGNRERLKVELGLNTDARVAALCPGAAFGPSKRWPLDRFARVASDLVERGFSVWVVGSASEAPLGAAIAEHEAAVVDLCGRTSLEDAVDLLSLADVTVTNDSGLLHIAAAVGSHVVALYGSTPPWFAPPLTDDRTVQYAELACSPCFKRDCPLGHHDCMNSITPASVVADVLQTSSAAD